MPKDVSRAEFSPPRDRALVANHPAKPASLPLVVESVADQHEKTAVDRSSKSRVTHIGPPAPPRQDHARRRRDSVYDLWDPRMAGSQTGGTIKRMVASMHTDRQIRFNLAMNSLHEMLRTTTRSGYRQPAAFEPREVHGNLDTLLLHWDEPLNAVGLFLEYCEMPTQAQKERFFATMETHRPDLYAEQREAYEALFAEDSYPRKAFAFHTSQPLPSIGADEIKGEKEICKGYLSALKAATYLRQCLLPCDADQVYRLRHMDGDAQKKFLRMHISESMSALNVGRLEELSSWISTLDINTQEGRDAVEGVAAAVCGLRPYSEISEKGNWVQAQHRLLPGMVKLLLHPDKASPESVQIATACFQFFVQLRRTRPVTEDWFVAVPFPVRMK